MNDIISAYLDVVMFWVKQFQSMTITLKLENGFRHFHSLVYLDAALEDDSPR